MKEATSPVKATSPAAEPKGTHSRALTIHGNALIRFEPGLDAQKLTPEPESQMLKPVSGKIVAVDAVGKKFVFHWRKVEIKNDGPVADGVFKITGTANAVR